MTEDFKNKLLKYLTGNLEQETGVNEPQFGEYEITTTNTRQQIATELNTDITNILIRGNLSANQYNEVLLYGKNNDTGKSFIAVFSAEMILLQLIQTYASGSDLFDTYSMQIDENGSIYGLSQDTSGSTYTLRVLLFNNIFLSNVNSDSYSVELKKTYIVPSTNGFHCINTAPKDIIKKAVGESIYYITGYEGTGQATTKVMIFQINVGSTNTWNLYSMGSNVYYAQSRFSVLINKVGDNYVYYAYGLDIFNNKYVAYTLSSTGTATNISTINISNTFSYTTSQILALNSDTIYASISDNVDHINYLYKVVGNTLELIESTTGYQGGSETWHPAIYYLQNINGTVFVTRYDPFRYGVQIFFGMIQDTTIYYKQEGRESSIMDNLNNFSNINAYSDTYINNQYNLYNIYINSDYNNEEETYALNKLTLIYNQFNYNGLDYENTNSLIPEYSNLYDEDGNIIFSRNLYNLSINGNTTISTIEIPNTMLNDTTIVEQNLISETNTLMNNNTNNITKNIYEVLDINFFNTLVMKNSNNPNNEILNNLGATRLNQSISSTNDYTDTIANKIRINYQDGTSIIQNIGTPTITNGVATYKITIYVPKLITNIEIISNDENTSYQTITGTFNINKYYNITQNVRVE